jgi:hypothetical protein
MSFPPPNFHPPANKKTACAITTQAPDGFAQFYFSLRSSHEIPREFIELEKYGNSGGMSKEKAGLRPG